MEREETQKGWSEDTADGLKPQVISYRFAEAKIYKWGQISRPT